MHAEYTVSTNATNAASKNYDAGQEAADAEFKKMSKAEKRYYRANTEGLRPDQHERLHPRATKWADSAYNMAIGREKFLKAYLHGYHTLPHHNKHYEKAKWALEQHAEAEAAVDLHGRYRSRRGDDRRDQFNYPVPR